MMKFLNSDACKGSLQAAIVPKQKAQHGEFERFDPNLFMARAALVALASQSNASLILDAPSQVTFFVIVISLTSERNYLLNLVLSFRLISHFVARNIVGGVEGMANASDYLSISDKTKVKDAVNYLQEMGNTSVSAIKSLAATAGTPESQQFISEMASALNAAAAAVIESANAAGAKEDGWLRLKLF